MIDPSKKTIKIKFIHFWRTFNPDVILKILKQTYNVIISDEPDYVIYSIFDGNSFLGNRGAWRYLMPELKGKFVKIFWCHENCKLDMSKCDWAFTMDYEEDVNNPRHMRVPSWGDVCGLSLIKKDVNVEEIKKQKTKFCCFVYSNPVTFRDNFFKRLSKYKRIDSPGKCLRNMPPLGFGMDTLGYSDENKIEFIRPYKFVIAFENSSLSGYTSEKIYQAMTVNSIPVYWGNPNIYREFNTKSFINYHDFESDFKSRSNKMVYTIAKKTVLEALLQKKMIERIIEIDNDDNLYTQYLKEPWYPNNIPSKYRNSSRVAERFREIFG